MKAAPPPPGRLYHYTDYVGLRGILETGQLRCTEVGALNDSREVVDYLDRAKRTLLADGDDEIRALAADLDVLAEQRFFVASFAERKDSLSLWRGYCPEGGVSLGFDYVTLCKLAVAQLGSVTRCLYSRNEKARALRKLLSHARAYARMSRLQSQGQVDREGWTTMWSVNTFHNYMDHVLGHLCAFKHHSFEDEREWRMVLMEEGSSESFARKRGAEYIECVDFDFRDRVYGSALREIVVWPSVHYDEFGNKIRDLAERHKICVPVRRSKSPFRKMSSIESPW